MISKFEKINVYEAAVMRNLLNFKPAHFVVVIRLHRRHFATFNAKNQQFSHEIPRLRSFDHFNNSTHQNRRRCLHHVSRAGDNPFLMAAISKLARHILLSDTFDLIFD